MAKIKFYNKFLWQKLGQLYIYTLAKTRKIYNIIFLLII